MPKKPLPPVALRLRLLLSQRPDLEKQGDLGKLIGRSQNAIGKWLRGEGQPRASDIAKLCDVFQVTADYLVGRGHEKSWIVNLDEYENPTSDKADWAYPMPLRMEIVEHSEYVKRAPIVRKRWREKAAGKSTTTPGEPRNG